MLAWIYRHFPNFVVFVLTFFPRAAKERAIAAFRGAVKAQPPAEDQPPAPIRSDAFRFSSTHRQRCANFVGVACSVPMFAPAPGFFWKRDVNGGKWRLYRAPGSHVEGA